MVLNARSLMRWFALCTVTIVLGCGGGHPDVPDARVRVDALVADAYWCADEPRTVGRTGPLNPEDTPSPRCEHTATWTGTEMIIWGGRDRSSCSVDSAAYTPATDRWRPIADSGLACMYDHTAVWTGTEMIIWGGITGWPSGPSGDGARYDPSSNTWQQISDECAPAPRWRHSAVWTGAEMMIWGGVNDQQWFDDGAIYDPTTDTWRPISQEGAPSPRADVDAVWTGTEMLIWGGFNGSNGPEVLPDGAAYDPALDRWRPIAGGGPAQNDATVWTGTEMLMWGARYNPSDDAWRPICSQPGTVTGNSIVWTGTHAVFWHGLVGAEPDNRREEPALVYDPVTEETTFIPYTSSRYPAHSTVWTGEEVLAWGGCYGSTSADWGSYYRPPTPQDTEDTPGRRLENE